MRVVNIIDKINPHFYSVWLSKKSHVILKGGRSSTKSSVISLRLVCDFLNDPDGNIICLRKVAKYLRTSVYEQIKWAIYELGVQDEFDFGVSPMQITHKTTGTAFYFFGVDDPQKLKSAKIAKGYIMALWFEELAEFSGQEDIDVVEDTYIRERLPEGKEVRVYFSYNPPRNPYSWVNEWVEEKKKDDSYMIHHSSYLDDIKGFLSQQIIDKIERYKLNDNDYWRWMYKGEIIGLGDIVYQMSNFYSVKDLSGFLSQKNDSIRYLAFATDGGHQVSATTTLAFAITRQGNVVLLDTYYYNPEGKRKKKPPSELAKDIYNFVSSVYERYPYSIIVETIDSAEGAIRNQYYNDYGKELHPVAKAKKAVMIDFVSDLLGQGRFFYLDHENNQIFIEEHKRYQWKESTLSSDDPQVVKENDHTCDAFQYFVKDNLSLLGLKF